jgi:hypothetical protein
VLWCCHVDGLREDMIVTSCALREVEGFFVCLVCARLLCTIGTRSRLGLVCCVCVCRLGEVVLGFWVVSVRVN